MNSYLDLTIAIPVKNEEKNLPDCLAAIGNNLAAKIIIIDSGSTDATKSIAAANGIEVIDFEWNGHFPKKRNWFLRNHTPSNKWVLFLDADEYITESFKQELRLKLTEENELVGYWLSYTVYFMGKQLKGGYPMHKLALFKVGMGEYENIDEHMWSKLDMEIHEHPILNGGIGLIKSKIDHQDFRGIAHYIIKHNEYAAWEAGRYMKYAHNASENIVLTRKQRLKYRLMKSVWIGPIYFFGSFFVKDGRRGFVFAMLKMAYFNQIYIRIKELMNAKYFN
jgi:glycosyltransferase involved in cell wall biosynthesis